MTRAERSVSWIADTSFIMCFGAVPRGPRLMYYAYDGSVGVTPTIRHELRRNATRNGHLPKGKAANVFATNGGHDSLLDEPFQRRDEVERSTAHGHIQAKTLPQGPPAPLDESAEGQQAGDSPLDGDDIGEAEAIAVALRRKLPMLMTDRAGVNYAKHRGIDSESFTKALVRLSKSVSATELYKMWRDVKRNHYPGPEEVPGPLFFRVPPPST